MKRNYEIALMQHVTGSVEDDYETVDYITEYDSYYACRRKAKELFMHLGEEHVKGANVAFPAREKGYQQGLDKGLAAVKIVCYTETPETTYEPLYYEYYKNGKVDYKLDFTKM